MTAIAYRDGVMAADTAVWGADGHTIVYHKSKIYRLRDGSLFAGCGASADIEAVAGWFDNGGPKPELVMPDDFLALLVMPDGTTHQVDKLGRAAAFDAPFAALGMPTQFMLGALYVGCTAADAVSLAIAHTDGAGGRVETARLRP